MPRGTLNRLDAAISLKPSKISVLVGINDVQRGLVSVENTVACIALMWDKISAAGIQPIAITYPTMNSSIITNRVQLNEQIRREAALRSLVVVDFAKLENIKTVDGNEVTR